MVTLSEEGRRMQEMMKMYNMGGMDMDMFAAPKTLVLNTNHALVQYVFAHAEEEDTALFCKQLYDLALLTHGSLSGDRMGEFVARSNTIMMKLAK